MRRRRAHPWLRELLAESRLHASDLILPLFVVEGEGKQEAIPSLPDVYRLSIDAVVAKAQSAKTLGIPAVALFPVIELARKTERAEEAYRKGNLICRAVETIKKQVPGLGVICDVALDPYTLSGHDGIMIEGDVANDETVELLCKQACVLADAGCDIVAPSDMMDGRIAAIRRALDVQHHASVNILSYAVKYASSFYGPFRDAVGSAVSLGKADKKTYQMDYRNSREALGEALLDAQEGADMLMVKPAMLYLDVMASIKPHTSLPILAYQVSGEYAMIKAAAAKGWLDEMAAMHEALLACKRAGASAMFTYAACQIAETL